jgi:hypothetical protein
MTESVVGSCLLHHSTRFLQVRADFLSICDGDEAAAKLLRILEAWTDFKRAEWYRAALACTAKKQPKPEMNLWVSMSNRQFVAETFQTMSENTVRKALTFLISKGYVQRRANPHDPYGTPQYLLEIEGLQQALNAYTPDPLQPDTSQVEEPGRVSDASPSPERGSAILQRGVRKTEEGVRNFAEGGPQFCGTTHTLTHTLTHIPPQKEDSDGDDGDSEKVNGYVHTLTSILNVPVSPALVRLVQDYHKTPGLSLLGQADAAHEWIDDPQRNRKRKRLSVAFFRAWLQRECLSMSQRAAQATTAPGPSSSTLSSTPARSGRATHSLMDLEAQYKRDAQATRKERTAP